MRFTVVALLFALCMMPAVALANVSVNFGRCTGFAALAGTALSANGVQTAFNTGSAGVAPGTSLTGNLLVASGTKEVNTQAAINCAADLVTAYNQLKGATCTAANTLQASDLAGITLTPGVYCSATGVFSISASTVTLDGRGDSNAQWIFQMSTTLTTATATSFILKNGAQAANVFWQVGSSASIGYSSTFVGSIVAYASISLDHDATVQGRLLAQAAVSFAGGNAVSIQSTPVPSASSGIIEPTTQPSPSKSGAESTISATSTLMMTMLGALVMAVNAFTPQI